jgi:hypothetical protein
MNDLLRSVRERIQRLVASASALVDPPLAHDAAPIEFQQAIVAEVEQRTEPAGPDRRLLPFNQIAVTVLAPTPARRTVLQAGLANLREAVATRLREIRCDVPAGLDVTVRCTKQPLPGWSDDQQLATTFSTRAAASGAASIPPLHVTVLRGRTPRKSFTLAEGRVHVGRSSDPIDASGRVRQNHIAFVAEDEDAHSRTVGRAHASIRYDAARGAYQLFDDGSRNGTRIVRDDVTIEVVRRDPIGITLRSGDEIQFGTAAIRVNIDGPRHPDTAPRAGQPPRTGG